MFRFLGLKYVVKQERQRTLLKLMSYHPAIDHSVFIAFAPKDNPKDCYRSIH
jgi:hypothetical protein